MVAYGDGLGKTQSPLQDCLGRRGEVGYGVVGARMIGEYLVCKLVSQYGNRVDYPMIVSREESAYETWVVIIEREPI